MPLPGVCKKRNSISLPPTDMLYYFVACWRGEFTGFGGSDGHFWTSGILGLDFERSDLLNRYPRQSNCGLIESGLVTPPSATGS
jgi:hypothetical protein